MPHSHQEGGSIFLSPWMWPGLWRLFPTSSVEMILGPVLSPIFEKIISVFLAFRALSHVCNQFTDTAWRGLEMTWRRGVSSELQDVRMDPPDQLGCYLNITKQPCQFCMEQKNWPVKPCSNSWPIKWWDTIKWLLF